MKASNLEYNSYKDLVCALIDASPNGGRGMRKAMAQAINCQVAYITHVLSGNSHFSLEQAEAVCRFFTFTKEETEYFILLVQYNRAGTDSLKDFFWQLMDEKKKMNKLLKSRLKIKETLNRQDQSIYYSSWLYAAIHMLLTIPGLNTADKIAEKLKISSGKALEILDFLCKNGLAVKKFNLYQTESPFLHLEKDSPHITRHHSHWRLRAIQSLEEIEADDLHYSVALTVSDKDIPKIKEILSEAIENCAKIIRNSKEENLASLCIDFFRI